MYTIQPTADFGLKNGGKGRGKKEEIFVELNSESHVVNVFKFVTSYLLLKIKCDF